MRFFLGWREALSTFNLIRRSFRRWETGVRKYSMYSEVAHFLIRHPKDMKVRKPRFAQKKEHKFPIANDTVETDREIRCNANNEDCKQDKLEKRAEQILAPVYADINHLSNLEFTSFIDSI